MNFGPTTTLTLTIEGCRDLPDVKPKDLNIDDDVKEKALRERDEARDLFETAKNELLNSEPPNPAQPEGANNNNDNDKRLVEAGAKFFKAQEKLNKILAARGEATDKITPNPFVLVSLDSGKEPIVFTRTYKETSNPYWQETFKEIPVGLLTHGRYGTHLLKGTNGSFLPSRLSFWIFHDCGEDITDGSKRCWERDEPKRDALIGRAYLDFAGLFCNDAEMCHDLQVRDCMESPLEKAVLRIKTKICTGLPNDPPYPVQPALYCGKGPLALHCKCGSPECETPDPKFDRPEDHHHHRSKSSTHKKKCKSSKKSGHVHFYN